MDNTPLQKQPVVETAVMNSNPRNFLVTFLLATFTGGLALRNFYVGDKKIGWLRLSLYVGGLIWAFLWFLMGQFILGSVGYLAMAVAGVWAIVDFFIVYFKVRTDAEGQALTTTPRDMKWAKVIFLVTIILWGLYALGILIVAVNAENFSKSNIFNRSSSSSLNSTIDSTSSNETSTLNAAYANITTGMSRANVEDLLGSPSDSCSDYTISSDVYATCAYGSYSTVYISISYKNDVVESKAKY